MPLVEQELIYPYGTPELTSGFSGVRVARSIVYCVVFVDSCLSLVIAVFVLRFTDYDYPFGIFND